MNFKSLLNFGNPFKSKKLAQPPWSEKPQKLPYTPKSVYRTRKDIKDWNNAIAAFNQAEQPRNYPLQLLYNEILTDALLYKPKRKPKPAVIQQQYHADSGQWRYRQATKQPVAKHARLSQTNYRYARQSGFWLQPLRAGNPEKSARHYSTGRRCFASNQHNPPKRAFFPRLYRFDKKN